MAGVKPYNNKADVMLKYCDRCFCPNIWQIILYDVACTYAYVGQNMPHHTK